MARRSKRDWLVEGGRVLTESGADGLTIETLTQRLGVTKGSFYHHFGNMPTFIDELLAFYENEGTLDIIAETETAPDPLSKLQRLLDLTLQEPLAIEVAFRAWALQNPQVSEVQARIDARRLDYLRQICADLTPDAQAMANMLYLVYVGSQQVIPPTETSLIRQLYSEVVNFYLSDQEK